MRINCTAFRISLAFAGAVAMAACSENAAKEDALAQDTTLTRDLALANRDTASQPQLQDVPVEAEPVPAVVEVEPAPRVRARAAAPPPARRTVVRPASAPRAAPVAPEAGESAVTSSGNTVTTEHTSE